MVDCGCKHICGDLPEDQDHELAVCKSLPKPPREPLVELVLRHVSDTATPTQESGDKG